MPTIKVFIRKNKEDEQEGFIWISFYLKRDKIHFSTKIRVKDSDFNEKKGEVRKTDKEANDKNLILESYKARINNVFVKYRLRDKVLTKEKFWRSFRRADDYDNFFDFFEEYQKNHTFGTSENTRNAEKNVMAKIRKLWPNLSFDDIDQEMIQKFRAALLKTYGNNMNTASKNLTVFKKYVRAAYKEGYMDENPFEGFHIYKAKPHYTYLTEDELKKLICTYRKGDMGIREYKTLEVFLFLCFSSMHIGDARMLEMERITEDYFIYYRKKLEYRKPEPIKVPMSEPLRNIISKIAGYRQKGKLLDKIPEDQTMNRMLKIIARDSGIKKPITLKTGRHTYATQYLKKTKDLTSLKEIMGHSDYKETLIYAHILDEQKFTGVKEAFNDFEI